MHINIFDLGDATQQQPQRQGMSNLRQREGLGRTLGSSGLPVVLKRHMRPASVRKLQAQGARIVYLQNSGSSVSFPAITKAP